MTDADHERSNPLLTKSAKHLVARGYDQTSSHADAVDRGSGINYTVFTDGDETYCVRAKEYVYKGLASFGTDHVDDAIRKHAWLVCWFDDLEAHYVFNAHYVDATADRVSGQSKRTAEREYCELPLDDGVTLGAFERGKRPETLAGDDATLGDFV